MKRVGLMLVMSVLVVGEARATPFLASDFPDASLVTACSGTIDGVDRAGVIFYNGYTSPAAGCGVDLAGLSNGSHNVVIKYSNVWGSTSSSPFTFTKANPPMPSNARIIADVPK